MSEDDWFAEAAPSDPVAAKIGSDTGDCKPDWFDSTPPADSSPGNLLSRAETGNVFSFEVSAPGAGTPPEPGLAEQSKGIWTFAAPDAETPAAFSSSTRGARQRVLSVVLIAALLVAAALTVRVLEGGNDEVATIGSPPATPISPTQTPTRPSPSTATSGPPSTSTPPAESPPPGPTGVPVSESPDDSSSPVTPSNLVKSTVQIIFLSSAGPCHSGSGTIVSDDGLIVTNDHVASPSSGCPDLQSLRILVSDRADEAPLYTYNALIVARDENLDLAVLRIVSTASGGSFSGGLDFIEIADSDEVSIGDDITIVGYPGTGGETVTLTGGEVSGFTDNRHWIKTDASISGGNSGGLAADVKGRMIGVPTRIGSGGEGDLVDCRPVADTNDDGLIDGNDTCVPTGGFINALRPSNFVLPLIRQAAIAEPFNPWPSNGTNGDESLGPEETAPISMAIDKGTVPRLCTDFFQPERSLNSRSNQLHSGPLPPERSPVLEITSGGYEIDIIDCRDTTVFRAVGAKIGTAIEIPPSELIL